MRDEERELLGAIAEALERVREELVAQRRLLEALADTERETVAASHRRFAERVRALRDGKVK